MVTMMFDHCGVQHGAALLGAYRPHNSEAADVRLRPCPALARRNVEGLTLRALFLLKTRACECAASARAR
jgi:hypothetical protein